MILFLITIDAFALFFTYFSRLSLSVLFSILISESHTIFWAFILISWISRFPPSISLLFTSTDAHTSLLFILTSFTAVFLTLSPTIGQSPLSISQSLAILLQEWHFSQEIYFWAQESHFLIQGGNSLAQGSHFLPKEWRFDLIGFDSWVDPLQIQCLWLTLAFPLKTWYWYRHSLQNFL